MRAMLKKVSLPLTFWDKAEEADTYLRSRTANGPIISGSVPSPQEAWLA